MVKKIEHFIDQATELQLAGRLSEAESLYHELISHSPSCAEAYHRLGLILWEKGDLQGALERIQQAIAINPKEARYHCSLGQVLTTATDFPKAIVAFQRALELKPDFVDALFGLGLSLQETKQLDKAIVTYRKVISLSPTYADAYNNLGNALVDNRQLKEAMEVLLKALSLEPSAKVWCNLGNTLREAGEFTKAMDAYRNAIKHDPDYLDAYINLSNLLFSLSEEEACASTKIGRIDEAIELLRHLVLLQPESYRAYCNLGNAFRKAGRVQEALDYYRKAIELKPDDAISHAHLLFTVQYHPEYTSSEILREAQQFNKLYAARYSSNIQPYKNNRNPERCLRIGYVSPNFRNHVQSFFTIPLLSHHDHKLFKIFCYADVSKPDDITAQIKTYADHWRPINGLSDEEVAEKARADEIDILVDLTMYMGGCRPLLFARKPAPVQVAYLAYPGTTGLSTMDYRLTDPYLDPSEKDDVFYAERSIRLPDSFWCYDPLTKEPTPGNLPALTNGYITFGCLNDFCKVTDQAIRLWGACLAKIPCSRLLLRCPNGSPRQHVLEKLKECGVVAERVEFVGCYPRSDYLALHQRIDITLDTLPYNGHTTSLDSFWMGVPVVTRIGNTVVGRAGWSLLCNLGLRELAAGTDQDFVAITAQLANDLPKLASLRATLRERMEKSPLMDGARFARNVEAAYRQMWKNWV